MAIDAGQQLLRYRLIEKIGEGGMGVVWKAVDTTLDREGDAYYDLAPDGEAFVVVEPLESGARELRLIRGWVGELEELVPHPR